MIEARPIEERDRCWVREVLAESWGSHLIVSRGRAHRADELPGFLAVRDGAPAGLLVFAHEEDALEVVVLQALVKGAGIGTALLEATRRTAAARGYRRIWLVTTNDNTPAITFYERRGFSVAAIHKGAVDAARRLKPEIPEHGVGGVRITDEVEMELRLW